MRIDEILPNQQIHDIKNRIKYTMCNFSAIGRTEKQSNQKAQVGE